MKLMFVCATSVHTNVGVVLAAVHWTFPAADDVMEVTLPSAPHVAGAGVVVPLTKHIHAPANAVENVIVPPEPNVVGDGVRVIVGVNTCVATELTLSVGFVQ
jgi:hypothetical protein